jgi:energy-coupling factor transporter transmembrane protein EcfT
MFLFMACMVSDARTQAGLLAVSLTVLAWLAVTAAPVGLVGRLLLLGTVMLAPVFLLTPFVTAPDENASGMAVTLSVFAKGMSTMLVATVTASTLTLPEIHEGLSTLPLPRLLTAIIVQIFMQAGTLGRETSRMAEAISLRRASAGFIGGIVTMKGVSSLWLLRMLQKVERVAAAMELRGFDGADPPDEVHEPRSVDVVAGLLALSWMFVAVAARLGSLP